MKHVVLIIALSAVAYAREEPSQAVIIERTEYTDNLDKHLKQIYKQASVSLFGDELEHILILSPYCAKIKNYPLTGATRVGIMSATCRWFDGQIILKIP